MSHQPRAPQAFVLDEAPEPKKEKARTRKPRAITDIEFATDPIGGEVVHVPQTVLLAAPRRFRWWAVLLTSLAALASMWAGLTITQLIEDFFARSQLLGWTAVGIASVAAIALLAMIMREVWGFARLRKIESLQEKAARAINLDENTAAAETLAGLQDIYAARPDMQYGLQQLASVKNDIIDPSDRLNLAERHLLEPLDEQSHRIIARRARRVTLITTITPVAAFDILFVASQNLGMLREIASLYGGRPSTLSTLKLARMVAAHLAVAGGLALSDNLIQHFLGKGLLGKLSARFGEGAVNGILTTRIGLAAKAVCRPIPQKSQSSETLASLLKEIVSFSDKDETNAPVKPER
jgi:putative membrane protein